MAWSAPRASQSSSLLYKVELAYGLAGAGRRDEALRALRSFDGAGSFGLNRGNLGKLAEACVMTGDFDRAVAHVARVLTDSVGNEYTPAIFRLDPFWDPLRTRPDFRKLIAQR